MNNYLNVISANDKCSLETKVFGENEVKVVFVIFGTRPEAIKMCPVVQEMRKTKEIRCKVVLTGQHREMLDQIMETFGIEADYDLNIMQEGQTLTDITNRILVGVSKILREQRPDLVLVHGDTTTSFSAALAAYYTGILIGHVEAGLRTYNLKSPYPEEFNRQAVDMMSNIFFAPTEKAKENLLNENRNRTHVYVTGNTVIDALKTTVNADYTDINLEWASDSRLILMTVHRRENLGNPMRNIFCAVKKIVDEYSDVKIIYPIHMNPQIRDIAGEILGNTDRIRIVEPLGVDMFHNYMARSYFIMTDSGGVQEEAPSLGKPVLVLRNVTERPEGVEAGTLRLVGVETAGIYQNVKELLENKYIFQKMSTASNPYGDGHASERICNAIKNIIK